MSKTMQVVHDTDASVRDQGRTYMHCAKCLDEWKARKKAGRGVSPKEWARQQVALTDNGIQVWCTRHDCNIDLMTFRLKED